MDHDRVGSIQKDDLLVYDCSYMQLLLLCNAFIIEVERVKC